MSRRFSFTALILSAAFSFAITGCGGGGGEATFEGAEAQTAEEISESEAYEKQLAEDEKRMKKEYGN